MSAVGNTSKNLSKDAEALWLLIFHRTLISWKEAECTAWGKAWGVRRHEFLIQS